MKVLVSILKTSASLLLLLSLLVALWAIWEHTRDPLAAIDIDAGKVSLRQESTLALSFKADSREYRHLYLSTERLGEIEAFISLPKKIPSGGLPVVVILGGLEIDADDFRLIEEPGENVFIIYRYPYSPRYWYEGTVLTQVPRIRASVLKVPSQLLALEQWVSTQRWADSSRITLLGFSFGTMFLPAIHHLASHRAIDLNPGVMAYGGADLYDLLRTNLSRKIPAPLDSIVAWSASTAIHAMEPMLHLPYMDNEFLIINGTRDHQISEHSWSTLHTLTPGPKRVVLLDEGHMHPKRPELTRRLVEISREWLFERGLVE